MRMRTLLILIVFWMSAAWAGIAYGRYITSTGSLLLMVLATLVALGCVIVGLWHISGARRRDR